MKHNIIAPKNLKGFRDSLPQAELIRKYLVNTLEHTFKLFGFVPIDTPVLEYSEILLGKAGGETEKQIYRFHDHGKRDVAMRYDLTVPFARFMACHVSELYLPFKRYHIAKVFRGENTQKGRYREFMQCDFDIVGTDSSSSDFEILLLIANSLKAVGIKNFRIHISHRGIFNRFISKLGLEEKAIDILRIVDKLHKMGQDKIRDLLSSLACKEDVNRIIEFITPLPSFSETLNKLTHETDPEDENVFRIKEIKSCIDELGLADVFYLNPSITRGLDYYTGLVFETYLNDLPQIGSICSGGRYNNLTSLYTKEVMPGVGSSIGIDRLIAALNELGKLKYTPDSISLLILCMDETFIGYYNKLATFFREAGVITEIFPQKKKIASQFNFAEKKGIPFALICGEDEKTKGSFIIKDLITRINYKRLSTESALRKIQGLSTHQKKT